MSGKAAFKFTVKETRRIRAAVDENMPVAGEDPDVRAQKLVGIGALGVTLIPDALDRIEELKSQLAEARKDAARFSAMRENNWRIKAVMRRINEKTREMDWRYAVIDRDGREIGLSGPTGTPGATRQGGFNEAIDDAMRRTKDDDHAR